MSVVSGINCDSDVLIKCEVLALRGTTRTLREKIEDLKEKNEKLTKNIDFIRDCDRKAIEKLQKENKKLREGWKRVSASNEKLVDEVENLCGFVDWWCDKCDCPLHEEEVHRIAVKGLTGGYDKFCEGCFNEEQEKDQGRGGY